MAASSRSEFGICGIVGSNSDADRFQPDFQTGFEHETTATGHFVTSPSMR
jgi:hypothetical protein